MASPNSYHKRVPSHRWCLILLFLTSSSRTASSHRRNAPSSDSILDIINTQQVERMLAARRLNNDLDDDTAYQDSANPQVITYDPPEPDAQLPPPRRPHHHNHHHHDKNHHHHRLGIDALMRQQQVNDTASPETLSKLAAYHGLKLLKSSKNALVVTKKEYLKKDWCKTEPLVQRVKEDGCVSKTVINKFCYGQCNSFYIPKNPRRRRRRPPQRRNMDRDYDNEDDAAFKSCAFCKPKRYSWITVTLRCPNLVPPYRKKRIQRIRQCKCTAADVN